MSEESKVKCANCGTRWTIDKKLDEDTDQDLACPECDFVSSLWNFVPEEKGENNEI